jgi:hypothetical protein
MINRGKNQQRPRCQPVNKNYTNDSVDSRGNHRCKENLTRTRAYACGAEPPAPQNSGQPQMSMDLEVAIHLAAR